MGLFRRKKKETIEEALAPRTVVIQPNQIFLHGSTRYEPENVYEVPALLAAYFAGNGWLVGTEPVLEQADLSIDSSTLGHEAETP